MKILEQIQRLPESKRKIILWTTVVIVGIVLVFFWLNNFQKKLEDFRMEEFKKELNLPKIEELEVPKIEIPQINGKQ